MEMEEAKRIVTHLADGIHPVTFEVLPEESVYNTPKVIRALFKVLELSKPVKKVKKTVEEKQLENIANGKPRNAGLPWTDEFRQKISTKYQSGDSINELAKYFERTNGAVIAELTRQGLIDPTIKPPG